MILKLIAKKNEIGNVKTFIFESLQNTKWKAGQYLIYTLEHKNKDLRGKMRFFTISSAPFQKYPSITTKIFKNPSTFKIALNNLKIGDKIFSKGPDGDFIISDPTKNYVFIAGGIGITPFISIIRQLDFEKNPINAILLYSNHDENILFKDELLEISEKHKKFKVKFIINPQRLSKDLLIKTVKILNNKLFYISGPDPMVSEMEKILEELKVKKENIKSDYFSGYKV